jgi:hypothetical protein
MATPLTSEQIRAIIAETEAALAAEREKLATITAEFPRILVDGGDVAGAKALKATCAEKIEDLEAKLIGLAARLEEAAERERKQDRDAALVDLIKTQKPARDAFPAAAIAAYRAILADFLRPLAVNAAETAHFNKTFAENQRTIESEARTYEFVEERVIKSTEVRHWAFPGTPWDPIVDEERLALIRAIGDGRTGFFDGNIPVERRTFRHEIFLRAQPLIPAMEIAHGVRLPHLVAGYAGALFDGSRCGSAEDLLLDIDAALRQLDFQAHMLKTGKRPGSPVAPEEWFVLLPVADAGESAEPKPRRVRHALDIGEPVEVATRGPMAANGKFKPALRATP